MSETFPVYIWRRRVTVCDITEDTDSKQLNESTSNTTERLWLRQHMRELMHVKWATAVCVSSTVLVASQFGPKEVQQNTDLGLNNPKWTLWCELWLENRFTFLSVRFDSNVFITDTCSNTQITNSKCSNTDTQRQKPLALCGSPAHPITATMWVYF